ncbi:MAG: mannose-6-phosphate isomerase [Gammaproteobacteria bacterium]|nr:MAG: mannose-6-phosphate isomerase [Gammaproteobacteria bacterium]
MSERFLAAAAAFETWIRDRALPLWADRGFDTEAGAFVERLLPDGTPDLESPTRVRVQARQLFVYAAAHHLGWHTAARERIASTLAFLERVAARDGGRRGYASRVHARRGEVVDHRLDLYDTAFLILAFAWCHRAFGLQSARSRAEWLIELIDRELACDFGGWREGDYPAPHRRQNPHMHLFEAFLALYDATGEARHLARAGEICALFETRFFDPRRDVLREFFAEDLTPAPGAAGDSVEPGHMMEWTWLLGQYEDRSGHPLQRYATRLYARGLEMGLDRQSGLLYDEVDADGAVRQATKRCWPMTEWIKAALSQARRGRDGALDQAAAAIEALMRHYLDCAAVPGAWIDRRGPNGEVVDAHAPASTFYHLFVAAMEAHAYAQRFAQSG